MMKKTSLSIFAGVCIVLLGASSLAYSANTKTTGKTQTNADFVLVEEVSLKPRTLLVASGPEQAFNQKLLLRLSAQISETTELVTAVPADFKVVLASDFEVVDSEGDFRRIRCNQVSAVLFYQGRQIAAKVVTPKELPRKLGEDKAKEQYLTSVVAELVPFLQQELLRHSNSEIAVSKLNFNLGSTGKKSTTVTVAEQVAKIKQAFDKLEGIVQYKIIKQDVKMATCSFLVVYHKRQFPQGLSNALNNILANK